MTITYNEWRKCVRTIENPKRLFPTGMGGVLYPPHSLNARCSDTNLFNKLAPTADDVWFWAMAKLNGMKHALVKEYLQSDNLVDIGNGKDGLYLINTGVNGKNDTQIKAVMEHYPEIMAELI